MNSKTILNVFASTCLSCSIAGCHSNRAESLTNRSLREIKSPAANERFSPRVIVRSDGSAILRANAGKRTQQTEAAIQLISLGRVRERFPALA
jgi:hypothetical protein